MRNKYRLVTVDSKGQETRNSTFPKWWSANRIFELAPLPRGHTIRMYRRRRFGRPDKLLGERGRGPRIGS